MSVISTSFNRPRSLRLSITPPALRDYVTTAPSPVRTGREPWSFESPSGECYERLCTVICLYDFSSLDPDHLSFSKNEILDIVRQEESGWWAAVRGDGSEVGWVPASYVHTLSDRAPEKLYTVLEKTRSQESVPLFSTQLGDTPSSTEIEPPEPAQVGCSFCTGYAYSR